MATTSNMFMYALTLKSPSAVTQAVIGQFAGTRDQQIVTAAGSNLSMYRLTSEDPIRLAPIVEHDVFGIIRRIAPFRLAGSPKDYLIITSDSGRLTIVEYLADKNRWQQVHLETFGKSGVRRVIPGEYLATDPKGRACMIASVEKNKLVYVLNRNPQQKVTISSPLEAHRPNTLVYAVTGLDVGYDNPVFAVLEVNYSECDQDATGYALENVEKQLVYYELDLGLNHVVRKWDKTVERTANIMFQVPGGTDGPSGVLVCAEDTITYYHNSQATQRVAVPRRSGKTEDPNRRRYIVSGVSYKIRNGFFFLLQSEDGDVFKVWFKTNADAGALIVEEMMIKYFDTIPVAASFCILRQGYLFIPSETGDHLVYGFDHLAEEDEEPEFSSEHFGPEGQYEPVRFTPRENYNITVIQRVDSMNPILGAKVLNLTDEDAPQIYSISGTGARSSLKTTRHGLEVSEVVESDVSNTSSAVWTVKLRRDDEYDSYIVLSFNNDTLVLGIGETVEEVHGTQFVPGVPTMAVQQMGEDLVVQIFPKGIRSITSSKQVKSEWSCPTHRTIVAAATNQQQVAIALSSGEILYFELDEDDILREWEDTVSMTGTVTCLSMGEVPLGRQRSDFLAIGCDDSTVRVLSLREDNRLSNLSVQALTSAPTALNIIPMADSSSGGGTTLYLHIGLYSGVYIRTVLDEISGNLSDTRTRFLGPKPVKIFRTTVKGRTAVLALSSRSWLGYTEEHTNIFHLAPLHYTPLEWAWNFSSELCPEGMVAVHGSHLRIFSVANLSTNLLTESIQLMYTPRTFARLPDQPLLYVAESNPNTMAPQTRQQLLHEANGVTDGTNGEASEMPAEDFGYPRGIDHWSSCIQVVDPVGEKDVVSTIHLENNETAVSLAVVPFASQNDQHFVLVGTAQNLKLSPRSYQACFIHVYELQDNGRSLKFVHKTKIDHPAQAILPFQGRALVGSGPNLRVYDLGLRQLLRKAQCLDAVPNMIVGLDTQGSRIIVADVQDSVTYVVYKHQDNMLIPFADDTIARWTTTATMVDYESVAGGDKFGNLWVVRAPKKASDEADEDNSGAHLTHEKGYLQGTPNRLEAMVHYFTQDIPTAVQKTQLVAGGRDVLFWAGLQGTLGILVPFVSREDVDFFQQLEAEMRKEDPPLAGRDHLIYRGYYVPVKGAIDGDLCERFVRLDRGKKEMIAGELDRSVREVERKVADMRTRVAF